MAVQLNVGKVVGLFYSLDWKNTVYSMVLRVWGVVLGRIDIDSIEQKFNPRPSKPDLMCVGESIAVNGGAW